MIIYLVLNIDDIENPYIIDICSNKQTANRLREKYIENFIKYSNFTETLAKDTIKIEEIDISTNCDVFWTAYPDCFEKGITYNMQL